MSAAEPSATPTSLDSAKIYPYIVTAEYLVHQPTGPAGLTYSIGHGLSVTLVQDLNGLVRNVLGEELAAAKLTPPQAHTRAIENLVAVVKSGAVTTRRFNGPQGKPFIIFTGHWLSASCVLLPDLVTLAAKNLGTDEFCICLPQRDSMLIFPVADEAFRSEMLSVIRKNESDARKQLSMGLFEIDGAGLHELKTSK